MELSRESAMYLFAAVSVCLGVYSLVRGEITFGAEGGDSDDDRILTGNKAKLIGVLLVASGATLVFNATLGFMMLLGTFILPWLIHD